jgi:UDP-glucose 4-epimerase
MAVLVTGGAGYIGSHMIRCLRRAGRRVVALDDLSSGNRDSVPRDVTFVQAEIEDRACVRHTLLTNQVDAVAHFAAKIEVAESVRNPRLYYRNNIAGTISLLEEVLDAGVSVFIFSSTAAVYGVPRSGPLTEDDATDPISPYGETKLAVERLLASYAKAYPLKYAALRYFNAAGAEPGLGERHRPESHLIPIVLEAALGHRARVTVFGRDYPTRDGTCIRDFVHVSDLVEAHLAALAYLMRGGESGAFNLGVGEGHSVQEVIDMCRAVTGRAIPVALGERRAGDPAVLVASPRRAGAILGWHARRSSLERIVRDAWTWHSRGRIHETHPDKTPEGEANAE